MCVSSCKKYVSVHAKIERWLFILGPFFCCVYEMLVTFITEIQTITVIYEL